MEARSGARGALALSAKQSETDAQEQVSEYFGQCPGLDQKSMDI